MKTKLFLTLALSAFALNPPLMAMENLDAPRRGATVEEQNEIDVDRCLSLLIRANSQKENFMAILENITEIKNRTPAFESEQFTKLFIHFINYVNRSTLDRNVKEYLLSELETIAPEAKNFAKNVPVSIKSTSKNNPQIGGQNKGASPEKGKCPQSINSGELQFLAKNYEIPIPLDQEGNDRYKAPDEIEKEKILKVAFNTRWEIALDKNKMSQEKGNMCHYQATLSSWFSSEKVDFKIEKIKYNESQKSHEKQTITNDQPPTAVMAQPQKTSTFVKENKSTRSLSESIQPVYSKDSLKELVADPVKWNNFVNALIRIHFNKPYEDSRNTLVKKTVSGQDYTVYRPNHALAHGMRQGLLAVNILDGYEYVNPNDFTSPGTPEFIEWIQTKLKTDPYFKQKVQLAASFQRSGRQSEADVSQQPSLIQRYEDQDSENFYNAAKNFVGPGHLFENDDEVQLYKQAILKSSKNRDKPYPETTKELQYLRKVLWTSHTLDLRRLTKTQFHEPSVMANAAKSLFGPETAVVDPAYQNSYIKPEFKKEGDFIKLLWKCSGKYLQATGDRYDGKLEDIFFIQANNPTLMVAALLKAKKSLNIKPHEVGIFLYAACPSKAKGYDKVEGYEWCVLLNDQKDGTYSPLGGHANPFEDEYKDDEDAVSRQVNKESGGLYTIHPATFDHEKLSPIDRGQSRSEFQARSLARLPNETREKQKARVKDLTSPQEKARNDKRSLEGESLEDLRGRRALMTQPSRVTDKAGNTLFFKEVPFYSPERITEESKSQKSFVWIPVRQLVLARKEPLNLKLSGPFFDLLRQPDTQDYLQNMIIQKPMPLDLINKMKANIALKSGDYEPLMPAKTKRKALEQPILLNPQVFTMFDKYTQNSLGKNAKDTQSNLTSMIQEHNSFVPGALQNAEQHPTYPGKFIFLQIPEYAEKTLFNIVSKEKNLYPWFVFYHALPADLYQVYEICSEFKSLLVGKSLKNNLVLRNIDDPFSIIQNIEDFYQKAEEEYKKGGSTLDKTDLFRKQGLSVNMTLFGGRDGDRAEYSIHRWLQGYSDISNHNSNFAQELLAQFVTNLGIPRDRTKRYQDLFEEYFTPSDPTFDSKNLENVKDIMQNPDKRKYGVMLQISINPDIIDQVSYLAQAGGKKHEKLKNWTPRDFLTTIRSQEEKRDWPKDIQTRLFLKPDYFQNPDYVKIIPYLSKEPRKPIEEYQKKLKELVEEDVVFLLSNPAPITKESAGKTQSLLELQERVTGNIRNQKEEVSDQEIYDWFSAKPHQTKTIQEYYDRNPEKVNRYLRNIHKFSYYDSEDEKMSDKGYTPIQLSLRAKNKDLFFYFLDKLDEDSLQSFVSEIFSPDEYSGFDHKIILQKLHEQFGDKLFESVSQFFNLTKEPAPYEESFKISKNAIKTIRKDVEEMLNQSKQNMISYENDAIYYAKKGNIKNEQEQRKNAEIESENIINETKIINILDDGINKLDSGQVAPTIDALEAFMKDLDESIKPFYKNLGGDSQIYHLEQNPTAYFTYSRYKSNLDYKITKTKHHPLYGLRLTYKARQGEVLNEEEQKFLEKTKNDELVAAYQRWLGT